MGSELGVFEACLGTAWGESEWGRPGLPASTWGQASRSTMPNGVLTSGTHCQAQRTGYTEKNKDHVMDGSSPDC